MVSMHPFSKYNRKEIARNAFLKSAIKIIVGNTELMNMMKAPIY